RRCCGGAAAETTRHPAQPGLGIRSSVATPSPASRRQGSGEARLGSNVLRTRLRYRIGTAKQSSAAAIRRTRGQLRRRPPCAAAVPRPALAARGTQTLRLTHALLAADLNARYVGLWPVAKRAWAELAGL